MANAIPVDTYKGESLQKKAARWLTHRTVRDWFAAYLPEAWPRIGHAFLASREGGDYGVLRSFGVKEEDMFGFEMNEEAAHHCNSMLWRRRFNAGEPKLVIGEIAEELALMQACFRRVNFPDHPPLKDLSTGQPIVCPNGDACWAFQWARAKGRVACIGSVFLDFCAHITRENVQTCIDVSQRLHLGSVLSIAVLKGREKEQRPHSVWQMPQANRAARRRAAARSEVVGLIESMIGGRRAWDPSLVLKKIESDAESKDPAMARWLFFNNVLQGANLARGHYFEPLSIIEYQSRTNESNGVPMLIVQFAKVTLEEKWQKSNPLLMKVTEESAMRWRTQMLREHSSDVAGDILNLEKGTVAALKAHATRGTYA